MVINTSDKVVLSALLSVGLLAFSPEILAADVIDEIENKFFINARLWAVRLQDAAEYVLLALATISFTWKAITLTLQGADLQEIVVELVKTVMLVGFFLFVIRGSDQLIGWIINGWLDAADIANDSAIVLSAGEIFTAGVDTGLNIVEMSDWDTFYVYAPAGLVVLVLYVLLAIRILLATVEAYLVSGAGVILLGFGGSEWTNSYAKRYFTYAMSVGIKLYVVYLIAGLGQEFVDDVTATADSGELTYQQALQILGSMLIIVYIAYSIPVIVQGLLTGASLGSPGLGGIARTLKQIAGKSAGMAAGGTQRSAIGGMALAKAVSVASAEIATGGGYSNKKGGVNTLPGGGMGKVGAVTGLAAKKLAGQMGETAKERTKNWAMGRHNYGSFGSAVAFGLDNKASQVEVNNQNATTPLQGSISSGANNNAAQPGTSNAATDTNDNTTQPGTTNTTGSGNTDGMSQPSISNTTRAGLAGTAQSSTTNVTKSGSTDNTAQSSTTNATESGSTNNASRPGTSNTTSTGSTQITESTRHVSGATEGTPSGVSTPAGSAGTPDTGNLTSQSLEAINQGAKAAESQQPLAAGSGAPNANVLPGPAESTSTSTESVGAATTQSGTGDDAGHLDNSKSVDTAVPADTPTGNARSVGTTPSTTKSQPPNYQDDIARMKTEKNRLKATEKPAPVYRSPAKPATPSNRE